MFLAISLTQPTCERLTAHFLLFQPYCWIYVPSFNPIVPQTFLQTQAFDSMESTMLPSRFSQLWIVPFPFLEWMCFNGEHPLLCIHNNSILLAHSWCWFPLFRYHELPTFARASTQYHVEGSRNQKVCLARLIPYLANFVHDLCCFQYVQFMYSAINIGH